MQNNGFNIGKDEVMIKKIDQLVIKIIPVIIITLSLSSCVQISNKTEEITLGVAWPFASDTSLFEEGIDMAVEEINEKGGIRGQRLRLLKSDDASETTKGLAVAQSMSDSETVMAVIGHKSSYISVPASAIYKEANLVMLSPASTAPELTEKDQQNIFRIIPSDAVLAEKLAEFLADMNHKRIVIYYSDDSYGRGLADAVEDQFRRYGITIVDRFTEYAGEEELSRLKDRWRAFGYDGIFVAAAISQGGQFIYDAGQIGINTVFIGGNALDSSQLSNLIGEQDSSIVIGSVFDPAASEQAKGFSRNFANKYGMEPDSYAALGYDAVHILAAALQNTENNNREEVAEKLRELGKWTGVCGVHEFTETGDEAGDLIVIKQLIDGSFSRLER